MVEETQMNNSLEMDGQDTTQQIVSDNQVKKEVYLDPEGGYSDPDVGRQAELAAMTKQCPVSVNNLPTKSYLEQTITPTVLRALSEVAKARPDNPLEFMAYYILKHNPNREQKTEGAPIDYRHPEDKEGVEEQEAAE